MPLTQTPEANSALIPKGHLLPSEFDTRPSRTTQIRRIINIFEKQYKTFALLGIKEKIYEKINQILMIQINIDLDILFNYDFNSFMNIIAAFYGRRHPLNVPRDVQSNEQNTYSETKTLGNCENALHTLLVMCFAARVMIELHMKEKVGQKAKIEQYQRFKDKLEDTACDLLNFIFLDENNGGDLANAALQFDHMEQYDVSGKPGKESPYQEYLNDKFNRSKELMAIAAKAKARKFLSQRPCLELMEIRNVVKKIRVQSEPLLVGKVVNVNGEVWWRPSNKAKLFLHSIFRVFYVVIFAHMLCRYPIYDNFGSFDVGLKIQCRLSNESTQWKSSYASLKSILTSSISGIGTCVEEQIGGYSWKGCDPIVDNLFHLVNATNEISIKSISEIATYCRETVECTSKQCPLFSTELESVCRRLCENASAEPYITVRKFELFSFTWVLFVLLSQFTTTVCKALDYVFFKRTNEVMLKFDGKSAGFKTFFRNNTVALFRTVLIWIVLTLEAIRVILLSGSSKQEPEKFWPSLWSLIPIAVELIYCLLFGIVVVTSLRFFHFVPRLAFFVHLFKKMWKTVFMFILLFCSFWLVLAVIHVSISRTLTHSPNTALHSVVSEGKFEIFGEVQDGDRNGELTNCQQFNRTVLFFLDMHYDEASCLIRSSIVPFIMFVYMFVSGILLVNLLTAQLTKEYENESEKSEYYKGYMRYRQLTKIESKMLVPPPFSFLNSLVRLFSIPSKSPAVWKTIRFLDGHPWGSVRKVVHTRTTYEELSTRISTFFERGTTNSLTKIKDFIDDLAYDQMEQREFSEARGRIIELLNDLENVFLRQDTD